MRADKAVRPAGPLEIGSARRVIRKLLLKFGERLGESQVVTLVDVHGSHNGQTLDVVGVCVNRIGTAWSFNRRRNYENYRDSGEYWIRFRRWHL